MGHEGTTGAITRSSAPALADHCGLPDLTPFGGHILATISSRRGSRFAPDTRPICRPTGGPTSPPSLIDLAARDRRWCQGNSRAHHRRRGFRVATRHRQWHHGPSPSPSGGPTVIGIVLVLQSLHPARATRDFCCFRPGPSTTARAAALRGDDWRRFAPKFRSHHRAHRAEGRRGQRRAGAHRLDNRRDLGCIRAIT